LRDRKVVDDDEEELVKNGKEKVAKNWEDEDNDEYNDP